MFEKTMFYSKSSSGRSLLFLLIAFMFILMAMGCTKTSAPGQSAQETAIYATLVKKPLSTPTPTPTPPPPATSSALGGYDVQTVTPNSNSTPAPVTIKVTGNRLNVRSGPGTSYSRIAQVERGDKLTAIGRNRKGDWIKVKLPTGKIGWVAAQYTNIGHRADLLPMVTPSP